MIIRNIEMKDIKQIKNVIQDSLQLLGLDRPGTAYFDPQLDNLYAFYNSKQQACYWVVEIDDRVVGGIGIAPFNEELKICELQKLYLAPEAQGLGISNKLMETALAFAALHYNKCYLETMHALATACLLYKKFGFSLLDAPLEGSEHSAMDAWYIKQLNSITY